MILLLGLLFLLGFNSIYNYIKPTRKVVYILRGLPGSGKTKWVQNALIDRNIKGSYEIISSNYFFMKKDNRNTFKLNPSEVPMSHSSCLNDYIQNLIAKTDTIFFNNINSQKWEYQNYISLAKIFNYDVEIIELGCDDINHVEYYKDRSKIEVPLKVCKGLYNKWEYDSRSEIIPAYIENFPGDSFPYPKKTKKELDNELDCIYYQRLNSLYTKNI